MSSTTYHYDATGVLARLGATGEESLRFWRGARVVNELRTRSGASSRFTWLQTAGAPLAEIVSGSGPRKSLLASSLSGSVVLEADQTVRSVSYAPYGHRSSDASGGAVTEPAFNGEVLDAVSGCYLLGVGHHRPYSPMLRHFLAPDRAGPFGRGGLNTLSYCAADPVNRTDPTGHFWKWVLAAVGIVVGAAAVALSFGTASGAVGAVLAGGIGALTKTGAAAIAGTTLGVAGVGVELGAVGAGIAGDEKTAAILGWVGLGIGAVGSVGAVASKVMKAAGKAAGKLASKQASFSSRAGSIRKASATSTNSGKKMPSLMDEILAPQFGSHQEQTVMMMRIGGGGGQRAARAPVSLYADAASEELARRRGYPLLGELSRRGERNAMGNAHNYIRNNGFTENMFDFDRQGGLYNLVDRQFTRWDPTSLRQSRSAREIPANLPEYQRPPGAPPSYDESLGHPVLPEAPPYEMGPPPAFRP